MENLLAELKNTKLNSSKAFELVRDENNKLKTQELNGKLYVGATRNGTTKSWELSWLVAKLEAGEAIEEAGKVVFKGGSTQVELDW